MIIVVVDLACAFVPLLKHAVVDDLKRDIPLALFRSSSTTYEENTKGKPVLTYEDVCWKGRILFVRIRQAPFILWESYE